MPLFLYSSTFVALCSVSEFRRSTVPAPFLTTILGANVTESVEWIVFDLLPREKFKIAESSIDNCSLNSFYNEEKRVCVQLLRCAECMSTGNRKPMGVEIKMADKTSNLKEGQVKASIIR